MKEKKKDTIYFHNPAEKQIMDDFMKSWFLIAKQLEKKMKEILLRDKEEQ